MKSKHIGWLLLALSACNTPHSDADQLALMKSYEFLSDRTHALLQAIDAHAEDRQAPHTQSPFSDAQNTLDHYVVAIKEEAPTYQLDSLSRAAYTLLLQLPLADSLQDHTLHQAMTQGPLPLSTTYHQWVVALALSRNLYHRAEGLSSPYPPNPDPFTAERPITLALPPAGTLTLLLAYPEGYDSRLDEFAGEETFVLHNQTGQSWPLQAQPSPYCFILTGPSPTQPGTYTLQGTIPIKPNPQLPWRPTLFHTQTPVTLVE